jgi:UDP-N-acetylglucosamine--N-acetylmuramyl-(pentapeptide) pyrophosphoryl-undecaprenol N-acetylglucosamine transferase
MRYLITGGGTGGHIYPALSIANEIKDRHSSAEILYVGTKEGLEAELVPKEGFKFETIRVKGMPRSLNKESFIAMKELFLGLKDSKKIIKEFKPDVVIGTGGYVCGPVVYQAARKNIATVIHEQNAFPGVTNKILSRYVNNILITFKESEKYFKYPEKIILTGNPIRKDIMQIDKNKAYKDLNISPEIPFILSFGGSGGQKKLNDAMYYVIEKNSNNPNSQILHITGKRFYKEFMEDIEKKKIKLGKSIKILPYFYDMPKGLNIADLAITSAGAITLSEISAIGVPSILIPKSYTAENHQEYNALAFEDKGAAKVILEKDLTGRHLNEIINNIINDKNKLIEMSTNSNASEKIVDIIDNLI